MRANFETRIRQTQPRLLRDGGDAATVGVDESFDGAGFGGAHVGQGDEETNGIRAARGRISGRGVVHAVHVGHAMGLRSA